MKKYILSISSLLFLNTTHSQVLYDDNFDNYTLGNLGTDYNGVTPGQGGWLTEITSYGGTKHNGFSTITAETGRGKVITITSPIPAHFYFHLKRPGLNNEIDQRNTGNNVVKVEFDFFTGAQQNMLHIGNAHSIRIEHSIVNRPLVEFYYRPLTGSMGARYYDGIKGEDAQIDKAGDYILPFNTWVSFIVYLDYDNKKVYFETPYFNTVAVGDFLSQSTSTNLMEDFKPTSFFYIFSAPAQVDQPMINKLDNIKITALNAVPPHILSVNTILAEQFNLYPNPATNMVNITNGENHLVNQVVIYDVTGKQLSTQTFNNQAEIQLNVENLASGVYMLHIQTNEGTAVKKLVKK